MIVAEMLVTDAAPGIQTCLQLEKWNIFFKCNDNLM